MNSIAIKYLKVDDINNDMLDKFDRTQHVNRIYVLKENSKVLTSESYSDNWDIRKKRQITGKLKETLLNDGCVIGAYKDSTLIGFCSLDNRIGDNSEYINLSLCHVDKDCRNLGLGKKMFSLCIEYANKIGVKKIYISANDSYETQKFYESVGCILATWIDLKQQKLEPYDIPMEFIL